MLNIILTIDYEIFGDGTGDVMRHMVTPTCKILDILDKHGVPLTIMFEVCEYLRFVKYDDQIKKDKLYSYADVIREQVIYAYNNGHDVQLHIHPQWIDAVYRDQKWIMSNPNRSFIELSTKQVNKIITDGKRELEKIIHAVDLDYSCKGMRLTNLPWCEAPQVVFQPMIDNGIKVHSLSTSESPSNKEKGYWYIDKEKNLIEIPIHSINTPKYKAITSLRLLTALYRRRFSKDAVSVVDNQYRKSKVTNILRTLTETYSIKWDFCKQTSKEMLKLLKIGLNRYDAINNEVPLVMISHSKDFFNDRNLDNFLSAVKKRYLKDNIVKFVTLSEYIKGIQ